MKSVFRHGAILLVMMLILLYNRPIHANGVVYETRPLEENKTRITLKWGSPAQEKGIALSYYYLKNGKTLYVGYELKEGAPVSVSFDYDLSSAIPPIRIVLAKTGDLNWRPLKDIAGIEAEEYIRHLHSAGVIKGRPDGSFQPDSSITRAEFVTIIVRALGLTDESEGQTAFADTGSHWAKKEIAIAAKYGFVSGFPDKTFKPDNPVTVGQVSKVISKAFTFKTYKNGIYDKLKKGAWYSEYVKYMFDTGILKTTDSIYQRFNEDSSISRANTAIMISRALSTY